MVNLCQVWYSLHDWIILNALFLPSNLLPWNFSILIHNGRRFPHILYIVGFIWRFFKVVFHHFFAVLPTTSSQQSGLQFSAPKKARLILLPYYFDVNHFTCYFTYPFIASDIRLLRLLTLTSRPFLGLGLWWRLVYDNDLLWLWLGLGLGMVMVIRMVWVLGLGIGFGFMTEVLLFLA